MTELLEDLNYDFNYNLFLAKTMLTLLHSVSDRQKAVRWMRKLAICNRTIDEMKLRNDFMYYLVMNVQNGELRPPFLDNPPPGPLPSIAHLLPGGAEAMAGLEGAGRWADSGAAGAAGGGPQAASTTLGATAGGGADASRPLLYQHSPDGGAFLAAQPIPRCGAFCYLAVVSRSPRGPDGV